MSLETQNDRLIFKGRRDDQLDSETKKMLDSLSGGEQKPVFFCKDGNIWSTDTTSGDRVLGLGYYIPNQVWKVMTNTGLDILFPDSYSYGLMNNRIHQTMENLTVASDKNPDQYFLIEDRLLVVTTLETPVSELMKITSDSRFPLYGLRNGRLAIVVTIGTVIYPGLPGWPEYCGGFRRTIISPIAREILGLKG